MPLPYWNGGVFLVAIDFTVDWAKRAIDLVKSGAPDHKVVAALANREAKIKQLGMTEKQAGSTSALKDYLSALSMAVKPGNDKPVAPAKPESVVELQPDPLYNPNDFIQGLNPVGNVSGSSIGSGTGSKIAGYVIVGLVAVVILDKLMK